MHPIRMPAKYLSSALTVSFGQGMDDCICLCTTIARPNGWRTALVGGPQRPNTNGPMMAERYDDYTIAERVAKTHHCPDCLGRSRLAVRRLNGNAQAWCPVCRRTEGFRRRESLTAIWKRDPEAVPVEIANKLERKYHMQPMTEQTLATTTETRMLERIGKARWAKDLAPASQQVLAQLAVQYGLDPLMGELTIYEGNPYIQIAGLIRIAHRQKLFAGLEDRPMTEDERRQYGYAAPVCWIAKVYRKDWRTPAVGTGRADPAKPLRNNPVEVARPEWMARSRALRQALKLAFPHSLPFSEAEEEPVAMVDPETGEIINGQLMEDAPRGTERAPQGTSIADEQERQVAVLVSGDFTEVARDTPAMPEPEDQDEKANKQELRETITALSTGRRLTPEQLDTWSKNHYTCTYAELHIDGLTRLRDALASPKVAK